MKRTDFKPCANCGKGVAHTGLPLFWVVEIQRFGIDAQAVQRQHGMEQFFGGSSPGAVALADVFNDGAPLATPINDKVTLLLCEACALGHMPIAVLSEAERDCSDEKVQA